MKNEKDKALVTVCAALLFFFISTHVAAHAPTRVDPRFGGVVKLVDDLHVELVVRAESVRIYVLAPARAYLPVELEGASATLMRDDGLDRVDLRPAQDGGWVSTHELDLEKATRAIVRLSFSDRSRHLTFGPFDVSTLSGASVTSHQSTP